MDIFTRFLSLISRTGTDVKASALHDEIGVSCRWPNGEEYVVLWGELTEVYIQTTDAGPFVEDVFLVLRGDSTHCVIPQEATGFVEVIDRLQQLPGFDLQGVISAMSCPDNAIFPCWRRLNASP
jgi:hypothetical protein